MMVLEQKETKLIARTLIVVLVLLSVFLTTKAITQIVDLANGETYPERTVTITAQGEALAVADIASFSFTVSEEAVTSEDAQGKSTEKINKALAYLKGAGVEEKDIKTENYSVYPKYENIAPCYAFDCPVRNPEIVGYVVSQTIQIKVREIDNTGKFVSELTKFGINSMSGISFTIDDEDALYAEARTQAIKKAEEKMQKLAQDLGVRVGKVVSFSEETPNRYLETPSYRGDTVMMKAEVAPEIPQGENKYTVSVYVVYELK